MSKCKHERTEFIRKSRCYTINYIDPKNPVNVWCDFIIGIKCLDCNDTMQCPKEIAIEAEETEKEQDIMAFILSRAQKGGC